MEFLPKIFRACGAQSTLKTLILVIFVLIFSVKSPKSLKSQDYPKKKKTSVGFNETQPMVSRVSKKLPFFKNTLYRAKIRRMWSNFTAIYKCIFQKRSIFWNPRVVQNHEGMRASRSKNWTKYVKKLCFFEKNSTRVVEFFRQNRDIFLIRGNLSFFRDVG